MIDPADLARDFRARFGRTPRCYRAPGRVNLIGEHTDYNDGFVMPVALDRSTWVAAAPRDDRTLVVHSCEYDETATIRLNDQTNDHEAGADRARSGHWTDYIRGVAAVLGTGGADMLVATDVPIGAGLSSSAALEVAIGYALLDLASSETESGSSRDGNQSPKGAEGTPRSGNADLTALALACQRAEHAYTGTRCGVMDQMIACHGRAGHALMLDTRTLACRWLPLPDAVRVVVCNTMVRHQLVSSEYNARRSDCEAAVRVLTERFPAIGALRDATAGQLEAIAPALADRVFRRCRHVIGENMRVEQAALALVEGDYAQFGELMRQSHTSLRDDYEVSCHELDAMVAVASGVAGVYGARMTGGGFGGCAIALVDAAAADAAARQIARDYERDAGVRPDIWICAAGSGVGRWN